MSAVPKPRAKAVTADDIARHIKRYPGTEHCESSLMREFGIRREKLMSFLRQLEASGEIFKKKVGLGRWWYVPHAADYTPMSTFRPLSSDYLKRQAAVMQHIRERQEAFENQKESKDV
jgi:hypothetical protein